MACNSNAGHTNAPERKQPALPYEKYLTNLNTQKESIDSADWDKARGLLFTTINDNLPHYWIGTKWDFNGTTEIPKSGTIACGYFLTTTMKQTGYDIKRVWMAQQASSVLIKAYCSDIKILSSLEKVTQYLNTQPDSSSFIIGLDFHTGFVTKGVDGTFIIHSNYIGDEGVVKEPIQSAAVLANNKYFMIGNLGMRKDQIQTWMNW